MSNSLLCVWKIWRFVKVISVRVEGVRSVTAALPCTTEHVEVTHARMHACQEKEVSFFTGATCPVLQTYFNIFPFFPPQVIMHDQQRISTTL